MQNREGVRRFCRIMAALSLIGAVLIAVLLPVALILVMFPGMFGPNTEIELSPSAPTLTGDQWAGISAGGRLAASIGLFAWAGVQVAALWFLRQAFLEGAAGRWFSLQAVRSFRRFAWLSLAMVFVGVGQDAVAGLAVIQHLPADQREMTVGFSNDEFDDLFTALIMVFVAHMFAAGREVDEENAAFV